MKLIHLLVIFFNLIALFLLSSGAKADEIFDPETFISITAKPEPSQALTSPQPVTVIKGRDLEQKRGQTVTDAIKDAPGVSAYTTGTGVSKPVIRGLTSQRVLLVSDGVRQEFQQWGDEHSALIDPLSVDRIEILRGPNSLLYGSDALGGVISFSRAPLPNMEDDAPKLAGKTQLEYFSNNKQWAGGVSLFGASGPIGYRFGVSGRDGDNFRTPDGEVFNSAAKDGNGSGTIGIRKDWGHIDANYTLVDQKVELPEGDSTETPYQKLKNNQASVHAAFPMGQGGFEALIAHQKNEREEFESSDAEESILNFITETNSLDLKAHHAPIGGFKGTFGLTHSNQDLESDKEEQLIPSFESKSLGAFLFEELSVKSLTFTAGIRGDRQQLDIKENSVLSVAAQEKNYSQITGALGAAWRVSEPLAFVVNVGRGYRTPTAFELFSNGEHEGTGRFEVGNAELKPERSLNTDVGVRYTANQIRGEIAVFRNKVSKFIYVEPTGATFDDPDTIEIEDTPIFDYTQADATLTGGEIALEAWATPWLAFNTGYDLVRGKNDATGDQLPLIPADRFKAGVKFLWGRSYFGAGAHVVRRQHRIDPNETATSGYTLWDTNAGTRIPLGDTFLSLDLSVENLGDKEYFDHLSRNKTVGILNPGRSVTIKASLPFGIVSR